MLSESAFFQNQANEQRKPLAVLLSAEDLHLRYLTVQKALATLLETQTQRVRDASLRAYCERLHVRYFGSGQGALRQEDRWVEWANAHTPQEE